jgi:hypothetical protein
MCYSINTPTADAHRAGHLGCILVEQSICFRMDHLHHSTPSGSSKQYIRQLRSSLIEGLLLLL